MQSLRRSPCWEATRTVANAIRKAKETIVAVAIFIERVEQLRCQAR
jgi:hypothetical protein